MLEQRMIDPEGRRAAQGAKSEIILPGSLDVKAAGPLLALLLQSRGCPLEVDASEVSVVGAQCLQVLFSARQTWERDGLPLTFNKPSEAFLKSLEVAGLSFGALSERG